jgi:hypothetical protein
MTVLVLNASMKIRHANIEHAKPTRTYDANGIRHAPNRGKAITQSFSISPLTSPLSKQFSPDNWIANAATFVRPK